MKAEDLGQEWARMGTIQGPKDGVDYYNMAPVDFEAELLKTSSKIQDSCNNFVWDDRVASSPLITASRVGQCGNW